jgi:dienelactone hydrolase|tara:strand:+ start:1451 stop:3172 length:1722 start_codon:yes stop_codon:yes gene_type:complete
VSHLLLRLIISITLAISYPISASDTLQCVSDSYISPVTQTSGLSNPAEIGKYKYDVITYGEKPYLFSIGKPDLVVRNVTLPDFLAAYSKSQDYKYDAYHRFDSKNLPLEAKVWLPQTSEKKPVILIVHGNSDPGFDYLGEMFSSRGFVVVQVDQTYLNGLWGENGARGWILLEHLKLLSLWNNQQDHIFYDKLDLENVALIGMSRGGEAVALASTFNRWKTLPNSEESTEFGFGIRSVVALAPMDGQYQHSSGKNILKNTNYFVLQGGHDADVYQFLGSQQWQRVEYDDGKNYVNHSIYVYKANHINFNQDMSDDIHWGGSKKFYKKLLTAEQQEQLTKVFVSAFIELTLAGKKEYQDILRNPLGSEFGLPEDIYVSRFSTSAFRSIESFESLRPENKNFQIWVVSPKKLPPFSIEKERLRGGVDTPNNVLKLKLEEQVETTLQFELSPFDVLSDGTQHLTFSIAILASEEHEACRPYNLASDIKIEILNKSGYMISKEVKSKGSIAPLLTSDYSELESGDVRFAPTEPTLQTVVFPLELLAEIKEEDSLVLNITFKPTHNISVILDDIGIIH